MTEIEFKGWLKNEQLTLEKIILEAAMCYVSKHEHLPNFGYDLKVSQIESYNLSDGKDLCYDRLTTPLAYSLWYQARRINVFISHFYNKILEACNSSSPIEIFDLGAGTGCVQFCFGLAHVANIRMGKKFSPFRFINVDLSPFMLDYLRTYLWPVAIKYYPELRSLPIEYHVYSWSNRGDLKVTNPWICASYLFDSSDNEDYLSSNFEELVNAFEPSKIMFLTSSQSCKLSLLNGLTTKMKNLNYQLISDNVSENVFTGPLSKVSNYRRALIDKFSLKASSYSVSWIDKSFSAVGLEKIQTGLVFDTRDIPQHFDLFNPPLKVRREVQLSEEQKAAAVFEERPSIITGPAGCGKSVVVTEKIINIFEQYKWSKKLNILVTTFNKGLIRQLRGWLSDLLDARKVQYKQMYYIIYNGVDDGTGEIVIEGQFESRIKLIHFEMLGKYIGEIVYRPFDESIHINYLREVIKVVKNKFLIKEDELNDILNSEFLLEEYHRVIYGLQCKLSKGEDYYQEIKREGRGKKPRVERGLDRKVVWTSLYMYAKWMHQNPNVGQSYLARRQLFYNKLTDGLVKDLFDYVFVDEFQDCTWADHKLMSMMLKDVDNLILAGDLAQAVHIGQSGTIPRDDDMSRRKYHKLKGSYRLPYRISEAISPLSQNITKNSGDKDLTIEITPYKGAPPGARPIIVFAIDEVTLANKIIQIKKTYSLFNLSTITILEKDDLLRRTIVNLGETVETTTILRLKGLEKEFIVWSLQADILFEQEVKEFAYTIMTRTNCMLVIAVTPKNRKYCLELAYLLREDRIIYWDDESENYFITNRPT